MLNGSFFSRVRQSCQHGLGHSCQRGPNTPAFLTPHWDAQVCWETVAARAECRTKWVRPGSQARAFHSRNPEKVCRDLNQNE